MKSFRQELIHQIENQLRQKQSIISLEIKSISDASGNDQKSSAGDKHETSREMMRQELDILEQNLIEINKEIEELNSIKNHIPGKRISRGSLVQTNNGYFLVAAISGKITLHKITVIFISTEAPFTKAIWGLSAGQNYSFRGAEGQIINVN